MCSAPHQPLVIWGSVGCGKSRGVADLASYLRRTVLYVDPGMCSTDRALLATVKKSLASAGDVRGSTVLVLEDLEGFAPETRKELAGLLRRCAASPTSGGGRATACIATCNCLRDSQLKPFASFANIRLSRPNAARMRSWLLHHHPWVSSDGVERRGFSPQAVDAVGTDVLECGDLRRAGMAVCMRVATGRANRDSNDLFLNTFDHLRDLLQHRVSPHRWVEHAEMRDVALLQEHVIRFAHDVDAAAQMADALSDADATMKPSRYETRDALSTRAALYLAATATREPCLTEPPRTTGALAPRAHAPGRAPDRGEGLSLSQSKCLLLEAPALLRESWSSLRPT